jgi:hypothetical protein
VDVGTIRRRRGVHEDGGNQWRGSSGAAHVALAKRTGGVALARAARCLVPS